MPESHKPEEGRSPTEGRDGTVKFGKRIAAGMAFMVPTAAEGALKLYGDADYKSWLGTFSSTMGSPRNMSPSANDRLSSFKNETGHYAAFYRDAGGRGRCFTGKPNTNVPWFAFWDDNHVSSFQLGRSCS